MLWSLIRTAFLSLCVCVCVGGGGGVRLLVIAVVLYKNIHSMERDNYRIYSAIRRGFLSLEWVQIIKSVLCNFTVIWVLPFLNNPKDLDPSDKTDLDIWDCFGRKTTPSYKRRNTVIISIPLPPSPFRVILWQENDMEWKHLKTFIFLSMEVWYNVNTL